MELNDVIEVEVRKSNMIEVELKPPSRIVTIAGQHFEQSEHCDAKKTVYCQLAIAEAMTQMEHRDPADTDAAITAAAAMIVMRNKRVCLALGCDDAFVADNVPDSIKKYILDYQDDINGLKQLCDTIGFHRILGAKIVEDADRRDERLAQILITKTGRSHDETKRAISLAMCGSGQGFICLGALGITPQMILDAGATKIPVIDEDIEGDDLNAAQIAIMAIIEAMR